MKLVKHIFYILVWVTLALYLALALTLRLPAVQSSLAQRAAGIIAGRLGTSVSIGTAEITLPCHLTLKNVAMLDQRGETMLRAARLSARLDLLPLAEGRISIATAQLFGTHINIYTDSIGAAPNFQFVVDSLASRDTTSTPLDLRINSLIVRHSSLRYDCRSEAPTPGMLNPHHIALSDISMHMALKALKHDSINANIKRLALKEHSGLKIDRLSMKLECGPGESHLHDFLLLMPGTRVELGNIDAAYRSAGDSISLSSLRYTGSIAESHVTPSDLACLSSGLRNFKDKITLAARFHGSGDTITIPSIIVGSEAGDIRLTADGAAANLTAKAPQWQADVHDLALSAKTVGFISENLKGQQTDVPATLTRMGSIHLSGIFSGRGLSDIHAHSRLDSDAGEAEMQLDYSDARDLKAHLAATDINLRKLLANDDFGLLTADLSIEGAMPRGCAPELTVKGRVEQLELKQYTYNSITLNADYNSKGAEGQLAVDDPNAAVVADFSLQREGATTDLQLKASVLTLQPKPLHLADQWGEANFSADIEANYKGSSVNDAVGNVTIANFAMLSPQGNYEMEQLSLTTGWDAEDRHFITMQSDFGEARLTGQFDYATIAASFANAIAHCLPTLPGLPTTAANTHNDFTLEARITRSDWLQRLGGLPLQLDEPLHLKASINDAMQDISLDCSAPLFHYDGGGFRDTRVSISSPGDSLLYDIHTRKLTDDDSTPLDLHAEGYAHDNLLTAFIDWDNHASEPISGILSTTASFDTNLEGQHLAYLTINPSEVNIQGKKWTVEPSFVVYSDRHLDIHNFSIHHEQQHLSVSGTASEHATDTLSIHMQDIDVDYLLALVSFDAVDFDGQMSGSGSLRSLFGSLEADARLSVDHFEFQHGRMGTLTASVDWNKEMEQIDIHAICDDGPDAKTHVDGYVSPKRDSINLMIRADSTYLDFAQSFTASFISHIDGRAVGSVNLIGPLDAINLTGELVLNGSAHVKTLGCTYQLRNDTLRCTPNEMEFASCPIYDNEGHRAILTGGIHHDCLTHLTYDIFVDADNLLAYNFREFGDDTFYATAYATGRVGIHGLDNELRIEGDITPQQGTVFVYNAANPDAIADQEFITWGMKPLTDGQSTTAMTGPAAPQQADNASSQKPADTPDYRSDVYLMLRINATPDATVRLLMDARTNDYITLRGSGVLNTSFYNKGGFQMFGTYRVNSGTYELTIQDIIKKNFTFAEGGTAVFSGDPYDANLNLQARYTVNGVSLSDLNVGRSFSNTVRVNCLMNIEGQVKAPQVSFDLDLPNVNTDEKQMVRSILNGQEEMNQQVVYLLAVGRFYPQGANNAAEEEQAAERSQTSLAMQSLLSGTLSGQINSVLNSVINNSNWNFGANIATGDEGWNNAEYEGLVSGRMLNNRLLINGQFGYRDNATTAQRSFIGDFDISYLLLPNGNLALKVYNQTNDRYFTRSSLNTQGIGIIMKKDFDGLGDFFRRKKKK